MNNFIANYKYPLVGILLFAFIAVIRDAQPPAPSANTNTRTYETTEPPPVIQPAEAPATPVQYPIDVSFVQVERTSLNRDDITFCIQNGSPWRISTLSLRITVLDAAGALVDTQPLHATNLQPGEAAFEHHEFAAGTADRAASWQGRIYLASGVGVKVDSLEFVAHSR